MKTEKKTTGNSFSVFLILMLMIPFYGICQSEKSEDKTLSPYFFIPSEKQGSEQMPLKSTEVGVNIAGVIADVLVTQVYKNTGNSAIEAIYIFPASTRSAVYGMKMTIGERTIEARIAKKEEARRDYEEAKNQGRSASLLEQHRPNVFQMNVANIMPGDEIKVELRYTELLIPQDGTYEFVYPYVVGPRYSNTPEALATANENWISNPYTLEGESPLYTFDISLKLNAGLPVSDVVCESHNTDISFKGKDKVLLNLRKDENYGGNRDFILKYKLKGDQIASGLLLYNGRDENFFLAMIQPPKSIQPENIPPREYIFIVDVSGSMFGFPLVVSKSLIRDLIGNLKVTDKFNVILFAGGSEIFSPASVDASKQNINAALSFIDKQQGGGGTELLPALQRALALPGNESFSKTFIIATDGYVTVEKEAFELIRQNLDRANFFTFGIGTSVNRYLIEGMAHAGNGLSFIATSEKEAASSATKFRNYVSVPVLTNVSIDFNGFEVYDVEPQKIPDVFSERPILIFGKYRGNPSGYIDLKGITGTLGINQRLDIAEHLPSAENSALQSLWARERIRLLDDFAGSATSGILAAEITELGLKYNLLTNYTSFIAIDSQFRNENGQWISVKQPLPLPEGVSNYAIGAYNTSSLQLKKGSTMQSRTTLEGNQEYFDFDTLNDEEIFYVNTEKPAEFTGGEQVLQAFLLSNLKYPKEVAEKGITGTVVIQFTVNPDGTLSDIKIIKGVDPLLDQEALRVIRLTSGKWKPGTHGGKPVKMTMIIPVKFEK
jgi:Ca-activated chloride channel family protein